MTESHDELRPLDGVEMAASPESEHSAPAAVEIETTETAETVAALASAAVAEPPRKGKRLAVKLVQIGEESCFVDYGGRSEGSLATSELKDKEGKLRHQLGDTLTVVVKSTGDPIVFTLGRKSTPENLKRLQEAFEAGAPVEGLVKATNKGGFEITIAGARAFCPFSQIERGYCNEPEKFVGQRLPFAITTFERGGRNVVVSHRKVLEQEASSSAAETRQSLEVGQVLEGVVRRLQPYGAFIDIGGLDGLVHVSQIRHGHVKDPREVLKVGEKVMVKVLRIDAPGTEKERISLSMKELQENPWSSIETRLPIGSSVQGKVVRLAEFGAFVELFPGIDGLVHISQIAAHRIGHPSEELTIGQDVDARVLSVDVQAQKISLSLRPEGVAVAPTEPVPYGRNFEEGRGEGRDRGDRNRGRRNRREQDEFPSEYRSTPKEKIKTPDVSGMDFDDAIELLRQKFQGRG